MRGEHRMVFATTRMREGSSPHARGTHCGSIWRWHKAGLIPACAGNTSTDAGNGSTAPAHPRMRGEHCKGLRAVSAVLGSSPHARGTQPRCERFAFADRLIPACAGNTSCIALSRCPHGAHPRMRGEHKSAITSLSRFWGSSPHARGTLPCCPGTPAPGRLIPACAGNTVCGDVAAIVKRAHPRMRGEHSAIAIALRCTDGSSPHARGTHVFTPTPGKGDGLIPACAGNTLSPPPPPPRPWAHPRMRGEHTGVQLRFRRDQGSSPHARGTLGASNRAE